MNDKQIENIDKPLKIEAKKTQKDSHLNLNIAESNFNSLKNKSTENFSKSRSKREAYST